MNTIKFQHNWNHKLDCDMFTTIRRFTPDKFEYYFQLVDREFDVLVNGVTYCVATLVGLRKTMLRDVEPELLFTDTGIEKPLELFNDFKLDLGSEVIILMFKRVRE